MAAAGLAVAAPYIATGASALANWLLGRKKANTTTTDTSQNTTNQSNTTGQTNNIGTSQNDFTQSRILDSEAGGLRTSLIDNLLKRLQGNNDFLGNYAATGVSNINRGYDAQKRALEANLASRGLSYSPVAAIGQAGLDSRRIGEGIGFMNNVPLLGEELTRQRLGDVSQFLQTIPYGTSGSSLTSNNNTSNSSYDTTGTSNTVGHNTQVNPNSASGNAFGGLAQTLAYFAGQGLLGGGGGGSNNGYATNNVLYT